MQKHLVTSILGGALLALLTAPTFAALQVGAAAPDFTTTASVAGKDFTFSLKQALRKGPVVVYFFPSAFTQGCDIEAHTFATEKAKFTAANTTIIGVSADSIKRINAFSSDPSYCAGKFPVASDPDGKIAAAYGLTMAPPQKGVVDVRGVTVTHGFFPRTTFVIDREGKIVATLSSAVDHITPAQHVTRSLAIVQHMRAAKAR
ncbi:MAG: peroxiredoxin [Gammaproteobacteria bacterium]|nr:peroxiredoxin [Gammaproteobacteria bacterium]MBU6509666.1 peroxiredoxin [Gammaproteobacteria bacterium]MDE2022942.1 peroxiredoxin [Gammaproteobacteria bacterium]MDE2139053.1 peroxiredoxin [Gammaproteobacteria bacterium]MDE2274046.1 peroxiredoxin [Gammaproteobacteria bacterium]